MKRTQARGSALVSLLLVIALAGLTAGVALTAVNLRASSSDTRLQDLALTQLVRTAQSDGLRALQAYDPPPEEKTVLLDDAPLAGAHRACTVSARQGSLLTLTARCTQDGAARTAQEAVLAVSLPDALDMPPAATSLYWGAGTKKIDDAGLARAQENLLCFATGGGRSVFQLGEGQAAALQGSLAALGDADTPLTLALQSPLTLQGNFYVDGAATLTCDLTCRQAEITGPLTLGQAAVLSAQTVILHTPVPAETLARIQSDAIYMAPSDADLPKVQPLPDQGSSVRLAYFDAGPLS